MLDEVQPGDRVQKLAVGLEREPRVKRDERWNQGDAGVAAQRDGGEEILARVPFVEEAQHAIVDRLDRARDEGAAGVSQARDEIPVAQEMLPP